MRHTAKGAQCAHPWQSPHIRERCPYVSLFSAQNLDSAFTSLMVGTAISIGLCGFILFKPQSASRPAVSAHAEQGADGSVSTHTRPREKRGCPRGGKPIGAVGVQRSFDTFCLRKTLRMHGNCIAPRKPAEACRVC